MPTREGQDQKSDICDLAMPFLGFGVSTRFDEVVSALMSALLGPGLDVSSGWATIPRSAR